MIKKELQFVTIDNERVGQRIDNFLQYLLKGVPKSHIYRLLRTGQVRVNKGRIKPDYRLLAGDVVRIPPLRLPDTNARPRISSQQKAQLRECILYEDDNLIVLNKPSGLAVHAGSGLAYGVIDIMRALYPDTQTLELVHRLDRETSGCLLLAKRRRVLKALHDLLKQGKVKKHYLALLVGLWRSDGESVTTQLRKNTLRSGERLVRVVDDGKHAESYFKPLDYFTNATLVDVALVTGRTHQIRVQAAHLGHPIAGDRKYGDADYNKQCTRLGLKRLFLHAARIEFSLPGQRQSYQFEAPLPSDLQNVLAQLQ